MYKPKASTQLNMNKYSSRNDIAEIRGGESIQELSMSMTASKRCLDDKKDILGVKSVVEKKMRNIPHSDDIDASGPSTSSVSYINNNITVFDCVRHTPKDGKVDKNDLEYGVRLKMKYAHLKFRDIASQLKVKEKSLSSKFRRKVKQSTNRPQIIVKDGGKAEGPQMSIEDCVKKLEEEGREKSDKNFGVYLRKEYPYLTIREIADYLGVNSKTMKDRVYQSSLQGYIKKTLEDCMKETPFKPEIYKDKVDYCIALENKYSYLSEFKIASALEISRNTVQKRKLAKKIKDKAGEKEIDVSGLLQKRESLKNNPKVKISSKPSISTINEMKEFCREAQQRLRNGIEEEKTTTGIGVDSKGRYYLASSRPALNSSNRAWAEENNITHVRGEGHAEAKILNNIPDIVHIEASRNICLECEVKLLENGVTTTTPFSGKLSQNAIRNHKS